MNMKKLISMLLTLAMVIGVMTPAAFATGEVTSKETLQATINAAPDGTQTTITLDADIDLGTLNSSDVTAGTHVGLVTIPAGKNIVLELNGHTLFGAVDNLTNYKYGHVLLNNGTLTIRGNSSDPSGTIKNTGENCGDCTAAIHNAQGATMSIESGNFETASAALLKNEGTMTISGGNLSSDGWYRGSYSNASAVVDNRSNLTITGGTFTSRHLKNTNERPASATLYAGGNILIIGGTFYSQPEYGVFDGDDAYYTIKGGLFNSNPEYLLDQIAYYIVNNNSLFQVSERPHTDSSTDNESDLKTMLAAPTEPNAAHVTLTNDITLTDNLTIQHASYIDLAGHTLTIPNGCVLTNNGLIKSTANGGTVVVAPTGFLTNPIIGIDDSVTLSRENTPEGNGSYTVNNAMDLQMLGVYCDYVSKVTLASDITIPDGVVFEMIPELVSTEFDGGSHSIGGVTINAVSGVYGMFQVFADVYMHDLTVSGNYTVVTASTGVIVGQILGSSTVKNVTVNGSVTTTGTPFGVAGFAGSIYPYDAFNSEVRFINCTNNATINAPGATIAGGFHGTSTSYQQGIYYINCTNHGNITAWPNEGYAAQDFGYGGGNTWLYNFIGDGTLSGGVLHSGNAVGTPVETTMVARTGTPNDPTFHTTLDAAITAAESDNSTIMLLKNCEDAYELTAGTTLVIDEVAGECSGITAASGCAIDKTVDSRGVATYRAIAVGGGENAASQQEIESTSSGSDVTMSVEVATGTNVEVTFPSSNAALSNMLTAVAAESSHEEVNGITTDRNSSLIFVVDETDSFTSPTADANNNVPDGIVASYDMDLIKKTVVTVTGSSNEEENGSTVTYTKANYTGGLALVSLPFANYNPSKIYTVYYKNGSDMTPMDATYDNVNKCFNFYTDHFSTYVVDQSSTSADDTATAFALTLVPVPGTEGTTAPQYNVVLSSTQSGKVINRFTAAHLTFELTKDSNNGTGTIAYFFDKVAGSAVNVTDEGNNVYLVNLNGVTYSDISGSSIVLGTVSFGGFGTNWKFIIKDATINTTSYANNLDVVTTTQNGLTINNTGNTTSTASPTAVINPLNIAAQKQNLALNVVFPNAITNQKKAYQDMKVTISGGDLRSDIVIPLGSDSEAVNLSSCTADGTGTCPAVGFVSSAGVGALTSQKAYTVTLTNALTKGMIYTVKVSGAGYRTTRYNVTMNASGNDGKTLTFWNNVMDVNTVVETGRDATVKVTYLAGDIVQDNVINIYDLSAAVSYFGTTVSDLTVTSDNAKYDLNRDGKIDSIDVAYVLVSWGK